MSVQQIINNIAKFVVNPVIGLLFLWAMVLFFWGVFELIYHADDEDARLKGRNHMIWGTVGIFILVSTYGILRVIQQFVTGS